MSKKQFTIEQIIAKLREAEVSLSKGSTIAVICRSMGITEQTYYRWRKAYGGMRKAKRLKELEQENARLRKTVSDLTLDKLILQEASRGNS
jgi:transposase-like protein